MYGLFIVNSRVMSIESNFIYINDKQSSTVSHQQNINNSNLQSTNNTKLCLQLNKASNNCVEVFENVLSEFWCDYAYNLALKRNGKPWG